MVIILTDEDYMKIALEHAKMAGDIGEVPVGALIVQNEKIISTGFNKRESSKNALLHAEIVAINSACEKLNGWRILNSTIYVTLEPCAMCAGAIINSRISRVVYGASDPKAGSFGSIINLAELPYNHRPRIVPNVCSEESAALLFDFFKKLR